MTNNIHVSSLKKKLQVNVSSDMSNYYSKLAKDWAVSNDIVNNEDYSSKYYANKTKITADDALYSINSEKENVLNEFINTKLDVITNIQEEGNKQISLATSQAQIATNKANEAVNTLNSRADSSLSNLTNEGEKHFLNKSHVTNCILEAPNGVATYEGLTVTVKAGLKVLIPNGFNSDGSLNNIEYTLPEDVSYTFTAFERPSSMLIIKNDGTLTYANPYFSQVNPPLTNYGYCFNLNDNYIYVNDDKKTIIQGAVIGSFGTSTDGISWLSPHLSLELIKRTDISQLWATEAATTNRTAYMYKPVVITQNYINGTSWYRIYSDCWCEQGGYSAKSEVTINLLKAYKNNKYSILTTKRCADGGGSNSRFINVSIITTSKFYASGAYNNTIGTDAPFYWQTKGYIA